VPNVAAQPTVEVMATKRFKAAWGSVRQLASGRWQARYQVGRVRFVAPVTFRTRREAESYLSSTRTDLERGTWQPVDHSPLPLREYATRWMEQRDNLRPRSRDQYELQLRLRILPRLGDVDLSDLTVARVRAWRAELTRSGDRPPTVAKAYRLLHAIMATALEDELILRNPCVLRGASTERPAERPVATVQEVFDLADAMDPKLRMMVLLAGFTGLRLGELLALRKDRVDLDACTVQVVEQYQELASGELILGPPKTAAGHRTVCVPEEILGDLREHLGQHTAPGPQALLFGSEVALERPISRKTFYRQWRRAVTATGMSDFRFHDLRHTANTLTALTGASTKELMARMGHASARAALIYLHATPQRDREIATALSKVISASRSDPSD
jgi:integrase